MTEKALSYQDRMSWSQWGILAGLAMAITSATIVHFASGPQAFLFGGIMILSFIVMSLSVFHLIFLVAFESKQK